MEMKSMRKWVRDYAAKNLSSPRNPFNAYAAWHFFIRSTYGYRVFGVHTCPWVERISHSRSCFLISSNQHSMISVMSRTQRHIPHNPSSRLSSYEKILVEGSPAAFPSRPALKLLYGVGQTYNWTATKTCPPHSENR